MYPGLLEMLSRHDSAHAVERRIATGITRVNPRFADNGDGIHETIDSLSATGLCCPEQWFGICNDDALGYCHTIFLSQVHGNVNVSTPNDSFARCERSKNNDSAMMHIGILLDMDIHESKTTERTS